MRTCLLFIMCNKVAGNDTLHRLVKNMFAMDDFGVKSSLAKGRSREDERALALMDDT